jgi:hypothetical protein
MIWGDERGNGEDGDDSREEGEKEMESASVSAGGDQSGRRAKNE